MSDDRRVVVIGSGPSGAIAARTLLQQGIPVTMLESGEHFPGGLLVRLMGRNVYRRRPPLAYEPGTVSSENPDAVWFRSYVPGGLSNYWTGAVPRFSPEDFREGERLHEKFRWPVSYEELAPYYAAVERLMGVTGSRVDVPQLPAARVRQERRLPLAWQRVAEHAQEAGQGLVALPMADIRPWLVTRSGAAFNSFTRIVSQLGRFPHFDFRLGAHALRLEWDGAQQGVTSVTYAERSSGAQQRIEGAAVVVAAGPLSSTKLLLDSVSADFPQGLGNTEGVLGRYLHDHPKDWGVLEVDRPLPRLGHAAYLTRAPYHQSLPLSAAQAVIGNSAGSPRDKALALTAFPTTTFGVNTFGTMIPTEENFVGQHPERQDAFGLPALDLHIRYGDEVSPNLAAARARLVAILAEAGIHASFQTPLEPSPPGTSVHYAGSVRMHHSPRYGMLDAWNRLHAVDNVVVTDASCFTTGVEKNPLLTSMALSARAARGLACDLKAGSGQTARLHSVA